MKKSALNKRRAPTREPRDIKDILVESEEAVREFLEQFEAQRVVHQTKEHGNHRKRRTA